MSCGTKRACRNHTITARELEAWAAENCQTGEKTRKPGPAVGGTLAEARRAPGLWDYDRPIESGLRPNEAPVNPRAAEAIAASNAEALARGGAGLIDPNGIVSSRVANYGGPGLFGVKCMNEGSTVQCFHNQTGVNKSWSVTGRRFTPAELARFSQTHCMAGCGQAPISAGAPPDAVTKARRIQPRNGAVRGRFDCRKGTPPPLVPGVALTPLPPLANQPDAEAPRPACVPDTIIGIDGGMFGSGWYSVIRRGQRLLVPNPELCGAAPPRF